MGYEAYREQVFDRQQQTGVITGQAELSPIDPYIDATSAEGKGWPEPDTVRPWDSLSDDEKRLFARMAEVYAGFLSHADHQIGRLLDYLQESGQLDNTIIVLVSDNGASGDGGPNGSVNENKFFNEIPDTIEANLRHLDDLSSPATYNHYPTGWAWAFNTPFKLWKRYSNWEGGTADPMIVSWPARITGIRPARAVRARGEHRADPVLAARHRAARGGQGPYPVPAGGDQLRGHAQRRERQHRQADPVLLDGRHPGDLAPGLEGRRGIAGRPRHVGALRHPALGAVQHRGRSHRVPRPGRPGAGKAAGTGRAVVGAGRPVRRPAAGEPRGARNPHYRTAAADQAAQSLRVLPRHRRGARVGRAEHPQPLLHHRGRGHHRQRGCGRRPVRARGPVRRPRPVRQGRQAQVLLQLRR